MSSLAQIVVVLTVMGIYGNNLYQRGEASKMEARIRDDYESILSASRMYRLEYCSTLPSSMTGTQLLAAGVTLDVETPSDWRVVFFPQLSITYSSTTPKRRGALLPLGGIIQGNAVTLVSTDNRIIDHKGRHAFVAAQQQDQCI